MSYNTHNTQKSQEFSVTSQRENFEKFITVLSSLKESDEIKLLRFYKQVLLSEKLIFIPQGYSYNSKNDKIDKFPLENWHESKIDLEKIKKRISEILESYEKKQYGKGVALKAEDYEIFAIDIDDLETFQKHFGKIDEVLKELEKDAYLINKSLKRGYHIYVSSKIAERVKHLKIDNSMLKNSYGFEVKRKGLIVFPPSKLVHNGSTYQCKLLYVNPGNFNKEQIETSTLEKIFEIIEKESIKKQFSKSRIETINSVLSRKRREYRDLKEIIREVKERVRIRDIIPERYKRRGSDYEMYICPFHPEDVPSFAVYLNHDGDYYIDFHDDEKGDVIALYERLNHCDFITALKELCREAGIEFPERKTEKEKEVKSLLTGGYSRFYNFLETQNAFYSIAKTFKTKGETLIRYAIDKKENQIWEVQEKIRVAVKQSDYETDILKAKEIIPINGDIEREVDGKKVYSYRAFVFQDWITNFSIIEGEVVRDALSLTPARYNLSIITGTGERINIKDKSKEELLSMLKAEGLITNHHKIRDALSQVISSMIKAGKITVNHEIPYSGFFLDEKAKELITSKIEKKEVSNTELRKAFEVLDKIVEEFYGHMKEKFVTILKWFTIAPFSFVAKQQRKLIKALYLFGAAGTGKTKSAVLASQIWGAYRKIEGEGQAGTSLDTVPRLGSAISKNTFPIIVNEPKGVFLKDDVKEALKNALTSTLAREKYIDAVQTMKIPALANFCFTSNHFIPADDALLRRMLVVSFSIEDRKNRKSEREFTEIFKTAEEVLPIIGETIVYYLEDLKDLILNASEDNQLEIAEKILRFLYRKAEMEIPEWLSLKHEQEFTLEDAETETKIQVIFKFKEIISQKLLEVMGRNVTSGVSLEGKVKELFEKSLIDFAIYYKDKVYITTKILEILRKHGIEFPSLKVLAEILGYEHKKISLRLGSKVTSIYSIEIDYNDFLSFIFPNIDKEEKPSLPEPAPETAPLEEKQVKQKSLNTSWIEEKKEEIEKQNHLIDEDDIPW